MFGKGVYFADMFEKSAAYAMRGYSQQDSYLMLLCEVALGKSQEFNEAHYVEELDPRYQSVKGVGRTGPDYDDTIVLPNAVKIPYGQIIDYFKEKANVFGFKALAHNEYVVYKT
mmetsp:Transcript_3119/g.2995  ORF Transcript_3119/g.2995 Transcript_3119/m.2995 type:complete len:114 (-) Transcript_3119:92-433(-)